MYSIRNGNRTGNPWVTREGEHCFITTVLEEYDLMLGYPWLHRENPMVDWKEGTWRFLVEDFQYFSHNIW
jgi:hypothetical protein